jgi:hypothetical protein
MKYCGGKTKTGAACRAPAGPDGLCFFHAHPDLARNLGHIGGLKNRSPVRELSTHESLSGANLQHILSEAIREVGSRKMTPRNAAALAQLSNSLHRVLPTADLERRLARIEQQLADQESRQSADPNPSEAPKSSETAERHAGSGEKEKAHSEDRAESDNDDPLEGGSS